MLPCVHDLDLVGGIDARKGTVAIDIGSELVDLDRAELGTAEDLVAVIDDVESAGDCFGGDCVIAGDRDAITIASAIMINGKAIKTSMIRWKSMSTQPP